MCVCARVCVKFVLGVLGVRVLALPTVGMENYDRNTHNAHSTMHFKYVPVLPQCHG